ncbi:MAG: YeeE/YedE thiosulfate transporter family protein [Gemmatimonadales bacterium]|jgi:hypothetical protein
MSAPFYEFGLIGDNAGLMVALVLGVGFGFFLERGGLGNALKLSAQFYLTDLTVLKVMFSAIVTAMLGLFWLSKIGLVDLSRVYLLPTFVLPQLLGGAVFGLGFVMGGLCPGTSCVSASSGRIDGLALLGGMLFGILVFNEAFPLFSGFYYSTDIGQVTIPQVLGVSYGVMVFVVVLAALASFHLAERLEMRARRSAGSAV